MSKLSFVSRLFVLVVLLTACSPVKTSPSPTAIVSKPITTAGTTPVSENSPFQAGRRYSDTAEDMPVSFLDVVAFQATVNEESESLDVLLQMRDLPEIAELGQVVNLIEYSWTIYIYLDASKLNSADFYLSSNTWIEDPSATGDPLTPISGNPRQVPFYQLFETSSVYNSAGRPRGSVHVEIFPDRNQLVFKGRVPGITSDAVFGFDMAYFAGAHDRPDHYDPSEANRLSTPLPNVTLAAFDNPTQLVPLGNVRAFPGPQHYAGDGLTFEIQSAGNFQDTFTVSMALDNGEPTNVQATLTPYGPILLPMAFDTTNLTGRHKLRFTTVDSQLDETYAFEVLPTDQRPSNETNATWTTREIDCCIFHYLSETAAARDIDFISEHFQEGANEFETIMNAEIRSKMDIYIIDRLLRNGGFGGGGKIMISYTDRYYGPTVGGPGLQTVARHEFSHAADISLEGATDGVEFDYEGLAVYVAGGHYKPEPIAQRAAALFDLGYFVPISEYIPQHEAAYLHAAAILTYIADHYGETKVWEFLRADKIPDEKLVPMAEAIALTFGVSLEEFNQGFQAWLELNEPGEQLDDLRLTIELQDLRRAYQDNFVGQPIFFLLEELDAVQRPEYRTVLMREARGPANVAAELIIAHGQQAIVDRDYARAQELIEILTEILDKGTFENPMAAAYLDIVLTAANNGYEVVDLNIQGDLAEIRATSAPPTLVDLKLEKINGIWQIQP